MYSFSQPFTYCQMLSLSLSSSDVAGAALVAECLLLLSQASDWKFVVSSMMAGCFNTPPNDLDMSGIFSLLVNAGFPKVRALLLKFLAVLLFLL